MDPATVYPTYCLAEGRPNGVESHVKVLLAEESASVPELYRPKFVANGQVSAYEGLVGTHYVSTKKLSKFELTQDSFVEFSAGVSALADYYGHSSDLLACHKFSRKQNRPAALNVHVHKDTKDWAKILILTQAKNRSKEISNGRGDLEGTPAYFRKMAEDFAAKHENVGICVIHDKELLENRFNLMHAVGRASINRPTFINLKYNGNTNSDEWVAFVGKGVCFDAGGLDIKPGKNFII